jgi:CTP synthase
MMEEQGLHETLCKLLSLHSNLLCKELDLTGWKENVALKWDKLMELTDSNRVVTIGVVGKYTENRDAYLSISKALQHACLARDVRLNLEWIDASEIKSDTGDVINYDKLKVLDGVLVPGGFGCRGVEGMIEAAKFCRLNKKPYLGICLGMQTAVVEFCRNAIGMVGASSQEFSSNADAYDIETGITSYPVIVQLPECNNGVMGGTMRLGLRSTVLNPFSLAYSFYNENVVLERHRHRYGVHPHIVPLLQQSGMTVSGKDEHGVISEIVELSTMEHPFFVGCQFHPEYKTRPNSPSPLFLGFIQESLNMKNKEENV